MLWIEQFAVPSNLLSLNVLGCLLSEVREDKGSAKTGAMWDKSSAILVNEIRCVYLCISPLGKIYFKSLWAFAGFDSAVEEKQRSSVGFEGLVGLGFVIC